MSAANTDKLRKSKSTFSTTLSSSITDADTTIPLSSTTGLPTDTAITLTIDRVDANGIALATVERVIGVISGSNLTNGVRANDGTTAQAHSSGAVVECIWDADSWNDAIDVVLAEHTQAGAHTAASAAAAGTVELATTAETTTGTDATRAVTPDGLHDMTSLAGAAWFLDEDTMSSDSATQVASQQSTKAYVDSKTELFRTITYVIDGGGSAITTGVKGFLEIPFACTINQVTMLADQSGSIVVDIWKDTYANYPPTDADTITASAVPTITTATKSQDATLTGWTTAITAGDILGFNVDSCTSITRVTISIKVTTA